MNLPYSWFWSSNSQWEAFRHWSVVENFSFLFGCHGIFSWENMNCRKLSYFAWYGKPYFTLAGGRKRNSFQECKLKCQFLVWTRDGSSDLKSAKSPIKWKQCCCCWIHLLTAFQDGPQLLHFCINKQKCIIGSTQCSTTRRLPIPQRSLFTDNILSVT